MGGVTPLIFDLRINGGMILKCPICGDNYLYHGDVDVFSREQDAASGLHVSVDQSHLVLVDDSMEDNPSPRRGGIRIAVTCEDCHAVSALIIFQHKGNTFLAIQPGVKVEREEHAK